MKSVRDQNNFRAWQMLTGKRRRR